MAGSMVLLICILLRVFLEVGGDRVFRPVDTKCIPICSNRKVKDWAFNCDGDNTTCDWQCSAQRKACPEGLTYHCAADYADFELHTGNIIHLEECALEKPCKRGEEPSITLYANGEKLPPNEAKINCISCSNKYFYNSQDGRLSSSYSRCFQEKFNKCIPEDNKIDCGESWLKRTESDGYCRCDARRGFAPENENIDSMCFYTDAHCMLKKCPSAQELALNYSCIINCPDGYYRTDDSDACVERASATAKTKPPTTASSTTDQTYTQSTIDSTTGKEKVVISSKKTDKVTGAEFAPFVVIIAWLLITICCHKGRILKEKNEKGLMKAARLIVKLALCQRSTSLMETSGEAVSTHNAESQQNTEEDKQSRVKLLSGVEQEGRKVETSGEAVSTHTAGSQKETEVDNLSRVKLLSGVEQEGRKAPWKKKSPSDIELLHVASLIGKGWRGLGAHLDIRTSLLDQIEKNNCGHKDIVYEMLREWRNSSSQPTLSHLEDAIRESGVVFDWDFVKQDILDKRHQNAALNNTPDEGEKNAATNDIPDEGDKNAVSVDNEMNNTLNARVEAHLSGRSIASSCNIASRSRTDETQF
ncbi:uncharacterized protein LOC128211945 [Mya arenaria]|uniref:uncharacterized protein LOC128211945 n=1 Tax=Mya arenaria TaxID=6604 RepID=UPI0022E4F88B|nr:uncharacterized protein LOC128211945 [Mya arenaria]XP_052773061.1 uncharacterized protein LOC128211945 [Mya arenaria]